MKLREYTFSQSLNAAADGEWGWWRANATKLQQARSALKRRPRLFFSYMLHSDEIRNSKMANYEKYYTHNNTFEWYSACSLRPCRRESKKLLMKLNVRLLCHSVKCLIREILNKWYCRFSFFLLYWRYLLLLRRQLPTAAKLNFLSSVLLLCVSAHKGDCTKNWQMKTIKSKVTSMNKFSVLGGIVENLPEENQW